MSNILLEAARHEENKCITVAAMVKRISTVKVLSKIKIILERTQHSEAESSFKKSMALCQAVNREKS